MTGEPLTAAQAGVEGFPGPFPVGRYAARLRDKLREFAGVCVIGEATGVHFGRGPNVYFELRDADGALPCAMWRDDFERSGLSEADFRDGVEVVAAGGCDYYVGGPAASPRFCFRVKQLRLAGEGDLLARQNRLGVRARAGPAGRRRDHHGHPGPGGRGGGLRRCARVARAIDGTPSHPI